MFILKEQIWAHYGDEMGVCYVQVTFDHLKRGGSILRKIDMGSLCNAMGYCYVQERLDHLVRAGEGERRFFCKR